MIHGQKEFIEQLSDNSAPIIDAQGRGDLSQIRVWLWLTGIFSAVMLIIGLAMLPKSISHGWQCILLSCEEPYSPIYALVAFVIGFIFFFGVLSRYRYYKNNPSMTIQNTHFNSKLEKIIIISVITLLSLVIVGLIVYHFILNLQLEETIVAVLAVVVFLIIITLVAYAKLKSSFN